MNNILRNKIGNYLEAILGSIGIILVFFVFLFFYAFIPITVYKIFFPDLDYEAIYSFMEQDAWLNLLLFLLNMGVPLILFCFLALKWQKIELPELKKPFLKNNLKVNWIGSLFAIIILLIGFIVLLWLQHISVSDFAFKPDFLFTYFVIHLLVAISEEMFFRGILLNFMAERIHIDFAILFSALFFSLAHISNDSYNLWSFINLTIAGILIATVYVYYQNIWAAIGFHWIWNFVQGAVLGFAVSGNPSNGIIIQEQDNNVFWTGGQFGFENSVLATIIQFVFIFILLFTYPKVKKTDKQITEDSNKQLFHPEG